MNETWEEARQNWQQATNWPYKRDIPRPAKQSVKSEMPQWKLRAIYGNNIPEEEEKRPIGGHG